ncbi:glycosyltransferase [Mammaliicoccus sciuri]|uniref:glycosyltransferase n=1 Tax=Mammaliicoccus sciuri TaxID=1296 RepID=UPI001D16A8AF|nr:glycosyltransferase [Mammaliicoccus sciuri]MDT0745283.1 glycosyltransferase [Mammaliicoccus sciuri]MDT0751480.1 glycosyltransferase [Mammaliicoccus sciuri]MEB6094980.1 glycosyltransferase [Mammaliicoccus sciuri]MEB6287375.1 glycosyltransferase [Mammaliicoccus sciuri]MEB7395861.1 glycosyltransferase [Mammaliicoccus sciuri]
MSSNMPTNINQKSNIESTKEALVNFDDKTKVEQLEEVLDIVEQDYMYGLYKLKKVKDHTNHHNYYKKVAEESKLDFLENHQQHLSKLVNSDTSRVFIKNKYKVGLIADEFLYNSFKDIGNIVYLDSEFTDLSRDMDVVIVATAWRGIDGSWTGLASVNSEKRRMLIEGIQKARKFNIPIVFYSKEDPVNFHLYKDIATECDIILTSAAEVVEDYKEYCQNDKVHVLQFGINPHYHNPVGTRSPYNKSFKNDVIFAGSWTEKYPVRNQESARIFDELINNENDLTIVDRNLPLRRRRYQFPMKYIPYLTMPIDHEELMKLHKVYRWAVNVNSVKYSETMFANRIFELQAFGNLILSNYSVGVNNQFPNVFMINHKTDVAPIMNQYQEYEIEDMQAKSIRSVMRNCTTYHRLDEVLSYIGIEPTQKASQILVIVDALTDKMKDILYRQLHVQFDVIEAQDTIEDVSQYDFITYMKDSIEYEEYYLEDLLTAFKYVDVDFVTKDKQHEAHQFIEKAQDKYVTMYHKNIFDYQLNITQSQNGYNLDQSEIYDASLYGQNNRNKKLSVIIPIHNNGTYLEDKCMRSLRRSSIFKEMEIIFVNDGSTDSETISIINRLRRRYPDIVYYAYEEGSGSASRPRNKGAELASTDYITYLDPDNEATGDGYATLLEEIESNKDVDMVVGNIIKEDNKRRALFNYAGTVMKYNDGKLLIEDPKKYMKKCGLRAQSIQALIIKSQIIKDNHIRMIEGAAGQDTLFFQELMIHSKKVQAVTDVIHMYYAAVSGSVTNSISKKLFDKYYTLEIERIPFYEKHGLLTSYLEHRFNFYVKGWYLPRLEKVKPEERKEAVERFLEIYSLYDQYKRPEDHDLNQYVEHLKQEVQQ